MDIVQALTDEINKVLTEYATQCNTKKIVKMLTDEPPGPVLVALYWPVDKKRPISTALLFQLSIRLICQGVTYELKGQLKILIRGIASNFYEKQSPI